MHYLKLVLLWLLTFYTSANSVSTRIYFVKCSFGGFQCLAINKKHRITYTCPAGVTDVTFYLWQFKSPPTTETVTIQNCTTLRLSFSCTGENKPITQLLVANISNLIIEKPLLTHNPPTVVFRNIANWEYIPRNTFSQIKSQAFKPGCVNPAHDLQNLHFDRVNIGTVGSGAFSELKDFGNFSWNEVKVGRVQHSAVHLEFNNGGNFSISKSNLEVCEHLAFKIIGRAAYFNENKFVDVASGAINGSLSLFLFSLNTVNNLESYAISILAETVQICDNRFEYLKAGALEKISPGLLHNSQRSFGALRFVYDFSHNYINFMDAGSLNPDMQAYDNVATELKLHRNALFCSCENLGWLLSDVGHGYSTALLREFYDIIVDEGYKNFCSYTSCELPLKKARNLTENGKCLPNVTAENLCRNPEPKKQITKLTTVKPIGKNLMAFKRNNSNNISSFLTVIVTSSVLVWLM